MLVAWFVINIPNLSPTHLVSNIRHQHRVIEQKPRESKIFSTIFLKKNFNLFFLLNLLQLYKLLLWFFSPLTIRLGIDKSPMKWIGFFLNVPLDSNAWNIWFRYYFCRIFGQNLDSKSILPSVRNQYMNKHEEILDLFHSSLRIVRIY